MKKALVLFISALFLLTSCYESPKQYTLVFETAHSSSVEAELIQMNGLFIYEIEVISNKFENFTTVDTLDNNSKKFSTPAIAGDVVNYYLSITGPMDVANLTCTVFGDQLLINEPFDWTIMLTSPQLIVRNGMTYVKYTYIVE